MSNIDVDSKKVQHVYGVCRAGSHGLLVCMFEDNVYKGCLGAVYYGQDAELHVCTAATKMSESTGYPVGKYIRDTLVNVYNWEEHNFNVSENTNGFHVSP